MKPDPRFVGLPKSFWAHVRIISQQVGYTARATKEIHVPSLVEIVEGMKRLRFGTSHLIDKRGRPTPLAKTLLHYFEGRANRLNEFVKPRLMNREEACSLFEETRAEFHPRCPIPMNKQSGSKRAPAYFTGVINMLIEANVDGWPCEYDPRELTVVTKEGQPLRTLARRVDGAFPGPVDPIAVWEIKEYYNTTTFGSRVADGIYESLLDGMELEELRQREKIDVKHYLMVDDHLTWWKCGRSYLCRIVDMMHMGYVDEALFGREIVDRLPAIVKGWVAAAARRVPAR